MLIDFLCVVLGLSIHGIFIFKRELLLEKQSYYSLLALSFVFFTLSYLFLRIQFGNPKLIPLLRLPLSAVIIFYVMKTIYFRIYKKNPEDTFWSMDLKLMKDGVFNFLFWVIGLLVPTFLAYKVF